VGQEKEQEIKWYQALKGWRRGKTRRSLFSREKGEREKKRNTPQDGRKSLITSPEKGKEGVHIREETYGGDGGYSEAPQID